MIKGIDVLDLPLQEMSIFQKVKKKILLSPLPANKQPAPKKKNPQIKRVTQKTLLKYDAESRIQT